MTHHLLTATRSPSFRQSLALGVRGQHPPSQLPYMPTTDLPSPCRLERKRRETIATCSGTADMLSTLTNDCSNRTLPVNNKTAYLTNHQDNRNDVSNAESHFCNLNSDHRSSEQRGRRSMEQRGRPDFDDDSPDVVPRSEQESVTSHCHWRCAMLEDQEYQHTSALVQWGLQRQAYQSRQQ